MAEDRPAKVVSAQPDNPRMPVNTLPAATVAQMLDRFDTVIDARTPAEHALDHIPGAENWPSLDNEQRIVIDNYFLDRAFVVEKIRFDDGTVLDEAAVRQRMGLPAAASPQASLSTPGHCCPGAAPEPAADGLLGLALAAGAVLARAGG